MLAHCSMLKADIFDRLRASKDLLGRYGVSRIGLFGSYARGDERPDSDIDLIAEFRPAHAPGLAFFALEEELAALFGRKVQISTLASMNRVIRERVERDLIYA